MPAFDDLVAHLARRGGIGHVRDGERFGISPDALGKYWRRHRWPMPHRGVLALPGTDMDFRRRALAAVTWIGGEVAATAATALRLHGMLDRDPPFLQLVVPESRRNRSGRWGRLHRCDLAFGQDLAHVDNIPTVPVAWAIRDRVVFGGPGRPRTHVITSLQRRGTTLEALDEVIARSPTAPGVPELADVVRRVRRDRVDSGLELDTRDHLRADGLSPWPRPFPTAGPDRRVMHLDVALVDHWVAVECEALPTHGAEVFTRDRTRWSQARRAGWELIFVWRDRLEHDLAGFLEEVREAVGASDPERPAAVPAHDCETANC